MLKYFFRKLIDSEQKGNLSVIDSILFYLLNVVTFMGRSKVLLINNVKIVE